MFYVVMSYNQSPASNELTARPRIVASYSTLEEAVKMAPRVALRSGFPYAHVIDKNGKLLRSVAAER